MKHKEMLLSGLLVLGCGINTKKNTLRDSVGSESRLNWSLTAPELNQRCAIAIDQLNSSLNQLSRSERQGFDAVISELEYSFASFYDQIEPISFYGYSSTEEELRKAGMDCEQKAQEAVLNIFTREDLF